MSAVVAPRRTDEAAVTVRRVVVVTRATVYEELLERHGTRGQVEFVLHDRGRDIAEVEAAHAAQQAALHTVGTGVPLAWRRAHVDRADLDRFLFEPDDIVIAVGPDGLVANLAKYLEGQPVIGVDAGDGRSVGRLTATQPGDVAALLARCEDGGSPACRELTMVEAELDDGRTLRALNEVFVGHRTHQSARYTLTVGGQRERQSSSGLIVSSGTGATGWAASIHRATHCALPLPRADEPELLLLVREAWPSAITGTDLVAATVTRDEPCTITSVMEDGTVFGDGIEADPLPFDHGRTIVIRPAGTRLRLAHTSPINSRSDRKESSR